MLDKQGLGLAVAMGAILYFVGLEYLIVMLVFLAFAVVATKYHYFNKKEMGIYEHERGWENVFWNGLAPVIFAVLGLFFGFGPIPYVGSVAAITADKFASELGVLGGEPINLGDLKPAKPGTSGAVSPLGTLMSLAGATIIGVSSIVIFGLNPLQGFAVGLCGFAGSVVDSIIGILEEKGLGTKGTTNLICAATGGLLAYLLINNGII